MGNTYEVNVWKKIDGEYGYEGFYQGESFILAIWNLWRAKNKGYGCVTLHWR